VFYTFYLAKALLRMDIVEMLYFSVLGKIH